MENEKYKEGEEFFEVTLELPKRKDDNIEVIAYRIMNIIPGARNVKLIPCKIYKEDYPRLSVSKDDYSFTIWKAKDKSQILKK